MRITFYRKCDAVRTVPCRVRWKKESCMKSNRVLTTVALALVSVFLIAAAGCKMSGMAVTSRGQLLKVNIVHPKDLPERGEDNIDIVLRSRGGNSVRDVLVDIELPPQLIV